MHSNYKLTTIKTRLVDGASIKHNEFSYFFGSALFNNKGDSGDNSSDYEESSPFEADGKFIASLTVMRKTSTSLIYSAEYSVYYSPVKDEFELKLISDVEHDPYYKVFSSTMQGKKFSFIINPTF